MYLLIDTKGSPIWGTLALYMKKKKNTNHIFLHICRKKYIFSLQSLVPRYSERLPLHN